MATARPPSRLLPWPVTSPTGGGAPADRRNIRHGHGQPWVDTVIDRPTAASGRGKVPPTPKVAVGGGWALGLSFGTAALSLTLVIDFVLVGLGWIWLG